jgi:hypothetical protein
MGRVRQRGQNWSTLRRSASFTSSSQVTSTNGVREESKTEIEYRRAMQLLEERLERQKEREWRRAEERRLQRE